MQRSNSQKCKGRTKWPILNCAVNLYEEIRDCCASAKVSAIAKLCQPIQSQKATLRNLFSNAIHGWSLVASNECMSCSAFWLKIMTPQILPFGSNGHLWLISTLNAFDAAQSELSGMKMEVCSLPNLKVVNDNIIRKVGNVSFNAHGIFWCCDWAYGVTAHWNPWMGWDASSKNTGPPWHWFKKVPSSWLMEWMGSFWQKLVLFIGLLCSFLWHFLVLAADTM